MDHEIGRGQDAAPQGNSQASPIENDTLQHLTAETTAQAAGISRRQFLTDAAVVGAGLTVAPLLTEEVETPAHAQTAAIPPTSAAGAAAQSGTFDITLNINGMDHTVTIEPRVTLLDALRERLHLTGSKKGCDHGQCGACTVHIDGRRVNSCLTLAIMHQGQKITTIEGLAEGDRLHPMQAAFIAHDGFQCGYCTPGQIMSAVALVAEGHARSADEIREQMSGNICRCGAYTNIAAAVQEVMEGQRTGGQRTESQRAENEKGTGARS
jgi:xanthine dehydrogenase YagT iron-sulfur-binding subunit